MSIDVLIDKIIEKKNPTVVGLDPKIEYVPEFLRENKSDAEAILLFNKGLIDALFDIVPAIKPQSAYYEALGPMGSYVLDETLKYAKEKGLYTILDVKRNDIGETAKAYARAYLDEISPYMADSVTISPYLGTDTIMPFYDYCKNYNKSTFVLVKTSNPSSGELQDLLIDSVPVYEKIACLVENIGSDTVGKHGYSSLAAVVGATYKEQIEFLRKNHPNMFFLIPGYGAQGGTAKDCALAFDENGIGGIVNSSRGIMCAYKKQNEPGEKYMECARKEAIKMREDLLQYINLK